MLPHLIADQEAKAHLKFRPSFIISVEISFGMQWGKALISFETANFILFCKLNEIG